MRGEKVGNLNLRLMITEKACDKKKKKKEKRKLILRG